MGITGGFGTLIDLVTGRQRCWYMRADGIRRWVSNDQPCDTANETDCGGSRSTCFDRKMIAWRYGPNAEFRGAREDNER